MRKLILFTLPFAIAGTMKAQVGIGTTTPTKPLEIVSNTTAQLKVAAASGNTNVDIEFAPTGTGFVLMGPSGNSAFGFRANGAERVRLATDGKVGIGTAAPTTQIHVEGTNSLIGDPSSNNVPSILVYNSNNSSSSAHSILAVRTNGTNGGNPFLSFDVNGVRGYSIGVDNGDNEKLKFFSDNWSFNTSATPTLTMTASAQVGIGTASPGHKLDILSADATTVRITSTTADNNGMLILNGNTSSNWGSNIHEFIYFQREGTNIGAITNNGTGNVNYATSSDHRLKTDFRSFNGIDIVNRLSVYDYAWKADPARMYGFKAHELQDVIPYAVTGKKDEVDDKGAPKYQMVDYSKLTPILTKAIQEQQAIIKEQEARINKLERIVEQLLLQKR
jgi:hypothetical protein